VDLVLSGEQIEGFLLVGAYRDSAADPGHSLASLLSSWREQPDVRQLQLINLSTPSLVEMVAEIHRGSAGADSEPQPQKRNHVSGALRPYRPTTQTDRQRAEPAYVQRMQPLEPEIDEAAERWTSG
jgi:hypothetical protein